MRSRSATAFFLWWCQHIVLVAQAVRMISHVKPLTAEPPATRCSLCDSSWLAGRRLDVPGVAGVQQVHIQDAVAICGDPGAPPAVDDGALNARFGCSNSRCRRPSRVRHLRFGWRWKRHAPPRLATVKMRSSFLESRTSSSAMGAWKSSSLCRGGGATSFQVSNVPTNLRKSSRDSAGKSCPLRRI